MLLIPGGYSTSKLCPIAALAVQHFPSPSALDLREEFPLSSDPGARDYRHATCVLTIKRGWGKAGRLTVASAAFALLTSLIPSDAAIAASLALAACFTAPICISGTANWCRCATQRSDR